MECEHVEGGHASTSQVSSPMPSNRFGRSNGEPAIEGIYELVSRRERPPGIHDEAFDAFALTVETATADLRAKWQEADYPGGLKEQEGVMFCAAVEALGLLRASSPQAYSAIIIDLFRRDPTNDELRSNYSESIAELVGEVVAEMSIKEFILALRQDANRLAKWSGIGLMLIALTYTGFFAGGKYERRVFGPGLPDSGLVLSDIPKTPPMPPPEVEACFRNLDHPLSTQ